MKKEKRINLPLSARSGGLAFSGMILIYLLITFIGQSVFQALSITDGTTYFAVSSLYPILAIFLITVLSRLLYHRDLVQLTGIKPFSLKYCVVALGVAVGMFLGLGFINGLFSSALEGVGVKLAQRQLPLDNFGQFIIVVVNVCVLPALFEEYFFRGFVLNSLSSVKPYQAILYVSLCFSLYHCSLTQMFYQLIYGGFLCALAISSRSALPCVLAHFINNFAIVLFTYLDVTINLLNPIIIICGLIVLSLVAIFLVKDIMKKPKEEVDDEERKSENIDFWFPVGIFGAIMCLVIMISNVILAVQ